MISYNIHNGNVLLYKVELYEKAFNSVETSAFMKVFRKHEIDEIYMKELKDFYKESTATIKLHKVSDKMTIKKVV